MTTARKRAYVALILFYLLMAPAAQLIKPILEHIDPHHYLLVRFAIATPLTYILLRQVKSYKHMNLKLVLRVIMIGILGQVNNLIVYTALTHTTSLQTSLMSNTTPILVTLAGVFFLNEREEQHEWLGLFVSVVGTLIVLFSPYLASHAQAAFTFSLYGNTLLLLHVLLVVVEIILVKAWIRDVPIELHASAQVWIGLVVFLIVSSLSPIPNPSLSVIMQPAVIWPILYMAIFGTIVSYFLFYYGYRTIEASEATLFNYLGPVVYVPLSVVWLGEKIVPLQIVGLVLIVCGVVIAEYHSKRDSAIGWFSNHFRPH